MALGVYLSLRASGVSKMSVIIVRHLGFLWILDELICVMHLKTDQAYSKCFTMLAAFAVWLLFISFVVII